MTLLTTAQAAAHLGLCAAHLERMARDGRIPAAQRFGRYWAWTDEALDQARNRRPRGGRPATCDCGRCLKCSNRLAKRASRARLQERQA